jgi:hypothetical protein
MNDGIPCNPTKGTPASKNTDFRAFGAKYDRGSWHTPEAQRLVFAVTITVAMSRYHHGIWERFVCTYLLDLKGDLFYTRAKL